MNEKKLEATGIDRKYNPMSFKKMLALSSGGIIWYMIFTAQARIQLYGLKVLGLDVGLVTLFMMIFTIVDIVNDPIEGRLSDKTKRFTKRFGKRWALILIGNLGMVVFFILQFIPWGIEPGVGLKDQNMVIPVLIWICLTISFFDCFQTLAEMNDNAVANDLFRDQESRRRKILLDTLMGSFVGLLLGFLMIPILLSSFNAFDTETGLAADPNAFLYMALVVSLIFLLVLPIKLYGLWEPKEMRMFRADLDEKIERPPFLQVVKRALTDKNWLAYIIIDLEWAITNRVFTVGMDLYVIDGLGVDIGLVIIPQLALIIGMTLFGSLAYLILKKKGSKTTFLVGFVVKFSAFLIAGISTNIYTYSLFVFLAGSGVGLQLSAMGVFKLQAIDDSILKHGTREEAQYGSITGVVRSSSNIIQPLILLLIVFAFGYDPNLGTANTPLAKFGLLFQITIILSILSLLSAIAFWKLSDITKQKAEDTKIKLLELGR